MMNAFIFRPETKDDHAATEFLTREAFWNRYQPGCEEHYLLHILRGSEAIVTQLCDVCEADGAIVGHIFYTRSGIVTGNGSIFPALTFGPVCVRPDLQGRGIGSHLIRSTLARAAEMGFAAVIITGDPGYYSRFGFRPASDFGIVYQDGASFPALMALELREGSLAGVSGRVGFHPAFSGMDPQAVERFDAQYPPKEKKRLPGQLV